MPEPAPSAASEQSPAASADVPPPPEPGPDDAIKRALQDQQRAEETARQPETIEQHIDRLPISEFKKNFLRSHPEVLGSEAARLGYEAAMKAGVPDDTEQMNGFILEAMQLGAEREEQHRQQFRADAARRAAAIARPPTEPDIEREAEKLGNEASALGLIDAATTMPEDIAERYAPEPQRRRPDMPIVAGVSRDVPSYSGQMQSRATQITLTPEERDIARRSFTDPNLSAGEKERMYAQNKVKLQRLRAQGLYPERERG
ncbi:hypothetical protein [Bradyrhizobium sp. Ai1a-2]|uniref:hypothetical protein n=1 Tax=Bradyrhizobium sp. Ai1a-2 TaxID=196490 RepID=UPI0004234CD2|nr:hypothetical protein [Bradyrhizobium sp. Ai1a-2]